MEAEESDRKDRWKDHRILNVEKGLEKLKEMLSWSVKGALSRNFVLPKQSVSPGNGQDVNVS